MNSRNFLGVQKTKTSSDDKGFPLTFYLLAFLFAASVVAAILDPLFRHFKKSNQRRHDHMKMMNSIEQQRKQQEPSKAKIETPKKIDNKQVKNHHSQSTSTKQMTDFMEAIPVKIPREAKQKKQKVRNRKNALTVWNIQSRNDAKNIERMENGKNPIKKDFPIKPVPVLELPIEQEPPKSRRRI